MSSQTRESSLILKVFSGPHVGAEILLNDGNTVIGSGDDCDVILQDQLLADRHVCVHVDASIVTLIPLDEAKVFINGTECPEQRIEFFEFFTLGNTHLAIGPSDEQWPHRDFPDFQLIVASSNESGGEQIENIDSDNEGNPPADEVKTTDGQESSATTVLDTPKMGSTPRFGSRKPIVIASGFAIALVMLGGSWFLYAELKESGNQKKQVPVTAQEIQKIIERVAPDSGIAVHEENGEFRVVGYVGNRTVERQLRQALRELSSQIDYQVYDTNGLVAGVKSSISLRHLALGVKAGNPGEVVVSGIVKNSHDWRQLRDAILLEVPRLKSLNDSGIEFEHGPLMHPEEQMVEEKVVEDVASAPQKIDLDESIDLPLDDAQVSFTENESEEEHQEIDEDFANLGIKRLVRGKRSMITLENGTQIFEGGLMHNGYILTSIQSDRLIFEKHGDQIVLNLGE